MGMPCAFWFRPLRLVFFLGIVVVALSGLPRFGTVAKGATWTSAPAAPADRVDIPVGPLIRSGEGWRADVGDIRIVSLKGAPREIGRQMAMLLGTEMQEVGAYYQDKMTGPSDPASAFFQNVAVNAQMVPNFLRQTPAEYLDELRGLADASAGRIGLKELVLLSASAELAFNFGCTTIVASGAATADGQVYAGKNFDWTAPGLTNRLTTLFVYQPKHGLSFAHVGFPGMFGPLVGVNEKGLFLSEMWVETKVQGSEEALLNLDGVPLLFLLREALQYASTVDEAVAILKSRPRTMSSNILLAEMNTGKAVVVEFSPEYVRVRKAPAGQQYLYSTNFFADSFMARQYPEVDLPSDPRYVRLGELLPATAGHIDVEGMVGLLRDRAVLSSGETDFFGLSYSIANRHTMQSSVFAGDGTIWVADGKRLPAADNRFLGFNFAELLRGEVKPRVAGVDNPIVEDEDYEAYQAFNDGLWALEDADAGARQGTRGAEAAAKATQAFTRSLAALGEEKTAQRSLVLLNLARARYLKGEKEAARETVAEARRLAEAVRLLAAAEKGRLLERVGEVEKEIAGKAAGAKSLTGVTRTGENRPAEGPEARRAPASGETFPAEGVPGAIRISSLSVVGETETAESVFRRYVPRKLRDGSSITDGERERLLRLTESRIEELGVTAGARATASLNDGGDGYDVTVRVSDGKGIYVEPFGFIFGTAANLAFGEASLTYHNLGGLAVNPYAGYRFKDGYVTVGFLAPGVALPVYHDIGIRFDTRGAAATGRGFAEKAASWRAWTIPTPGFEPGVELTVADRVGADSGLDYESGRWILGRAFAPYRFQSQETRGKFMAEYLYGWNASAVEGAGPWSFHRETLKFVVSRSFGRLVAGGKGEVSLLQGEAPRDLLPALGGDTILRGHEPRELVGRQAAGAAFELGWELAPGLLVSKAFVDAGRVAATGGSDDLASAPTVIDAGAGVDVETPMGVVSLFMAFPVDRPKEWRIGVGFEAASF